MVALESPGEIQELTAFGRLVACASRPQSAGARSLRRSGRCDRPREGRAGRKDNQQGKPANVGREDRRVRPEDLFQGSLSARSGVHPRERQDGRPGDEGSRRQGRRSDRRSSASCAMRSARASRSRNLILPRKSPRPRAGVRTAEHSRARTAQHGREAVYGGPGDRVSSCLARPPAGRPPLSASTSRLSNASPPILWPRTRARCRTRASWSAAATSSAAWKSPTAACRVRPATPWACWRR